MASALGGDTDTATLEWLVSALEHARSRGQTKVVTYLEEVVDEVVYEESYANRTQKHRRAQRFTACVKTIEPACNTRPART